MSRNIASIFTFVITSTYKYTFYKGVLLDYFVTSARVDILPASFPPSKVTHLYLLFNFQHLSRSQYTSPQNSHDPQYCLQIPGWNSLVPQTEPCLGLHRFHLNVGAPLGTRCVLNHFRISPSLSRFSLSRFDSRKSWTSFCIWGFPHAVLQVPSRLDFPCEAQGRVLELTRQSQIRSRQTLCALIGTCRTFHNIFKPILYKAWRLDPLEFSPQEIELQAYYPSRFFRYTKHLQLSIGEFDSSWCRGDMFSESKGMMYEASIMKFLTETMKSICSFR